jgi:N-glycosidase YbiA
VAEEVHFYRVRDPYGEFSNFAAFPITIEGIEWRTTEHYFQAQKFAGTEHAEEIRLTPSPMVAARKARSRMRPLRADWESVKVGLMRIALRAKFSQHPELRDLLLATGEAEIIEHTTNDRYWGDGGDGSGRNMLGRLLMDVRTELRAETASAFDH